MDFSDARQPTDNERIFLDKQIRNRNKLYQYAYYSVLVLTVAIGLLAMFMFSSGAVFEGFIILFIGVITCAALLQFRFGAKLGRLDKVDTATLILRVSGRYHRAFVGHGRYLEIRHYIGDISFSMPDHWFKFIKDGDELQGEAFFFAAAYDEAHQTVRAMAPVCVLVSLNNTYSVDREVPCGLMGLKANISAVLAATFLAIVVVLGIINAFAPEKSPIELYHQYLYDRAPVQEFQTVAELLAARSQFQSGQKLRIARAALIQDGENQFYLFDPDPTVQQAVSEFIRMKQKDDTVDRRTKLLQKFNNTPGTLLTKKANWERFDLFSDNNAYLSMKEKFLTEGKEYLEGQRKRAMEKAVKSEKEGVMPFIAYIAEFQNKSNEYRKTFLRSEERHIRVLQNEKEKSLRSELTAFYHELLTSREKIRLAPVTHGQAERLRGRSLAEAALPMEESIQGALSAITVEGNTELLLDQRFEGGQDLFALTMWKIILALFYIALLCGVRGLLIFRNNRAIIRNILQLYRREQLVRKDRGMLT